MTVDVVEKVMAQNKSESELGHNYDGNKNRHEKNEGNNGVSYYDRSSFHQHQKSRDSSNNLHPPSLYYKRPSSVSSSNHDSTLSSNGSLINSTDVSPGEEEEEEDQDHQHSRSNGSRRGTDHLLIRDNVSHDSLDELEYGPGIVAKLKSKFLKYSSITSNNHNNNSHSTSFERNNKYQPQFTRRASHNPAGGRMGLLLNKSVFINNKNSLVLKRAKSLETLLLGASSESVSKSCLDNNNDDGCNQDDNHHHEESTSVVTTPMAIVNPTVHDPKQKEQKDACQLQSDTDSDRLPLEQVSPSHLLSRPNDDDPSSEILTPRYDITGHKKGREFNDSTKADDDIKMMKSEKKNGSRKEEEGNIVSSREKPSNDYHSSPEAMRQERKIQDQKIQDQKIPDQKIPDQSAPVSIAPPLPSTLKVMKIPVPPARSSGVQVARGGRRTSLPCPASISSSGGTDSNSTLPGNDKQAAGSLRRGSMLPSVKPVIAVKPKLLLGNCNKQTLSASTSPSLLTSRDIVTDSNSETQEIIPVTRPPRTKKGSLSSSSPSSSSSNRTLLENCNSTTSKESPSLLKEPVGKDVEVDVVSNKSNNVIIPNENIECIQQEAPQIGSEEKELNANDSSLKVEKDKEFGHVQVATDSPSIESVSCEGKKSSFLPIQSTSFSLEGDSCPSSESTICGNNRYVVPSKSNDINLKGGSDTTTVKASHSDKGRQNSSGSCNAPSSTAKVTTPACSVIQDLDFLPPAVESTTPETRLETRPERKLETKLERKLETKPERKPSTPSDGGEQQEQKRASTSSVASDEQTPLITSKSNQAASSVTLPVTTKTMTPLPTQIVPSVSQPQIVPSTVSQPQIVPSVSQPVPAPRRTVVSNSTPSQDSSPPLPPSLPPLSSTKVSTSVSQPSTSVSQPSTSVSQPSTSSSSRAPHVSNCNRTPHVSNCNGSSNNSTCMIFDFRGKDVKPSLAISSPFGRSAVISNDDEEGSEDYRGSMEVPPPSGLVFIGENEVVGKGSLLKNRNKKLKIHFNDEATSTFEYPSESSMFVEEGKESNQWSQEVDSNSNKKSDGSLDQSSSNFVGGIGLGGVTTLNNNNGSNGLGSYKPSFLASQMRESSSFELGVSRLKSHFRTSGAGSESIETSSSQVNGSLIGEMLPTINSTPSSTSPSSSPVIVGGALIIGKAVPTMVESPSVVKQIVSVEEERKDKTGSWSTSTVSVSDLLF